jgi:hypothetical protein
MKFKLPAVAAAVRHLQTPLIDEDDMQMEDSASFISRLRSCRWSHSVSRPALFPLGRFLFAVICGENMYEDIENAMLLLNYQQFNPSVNGRLIHQEGAGHGLEFGVCKLVVVGFRSCLVKWFWDFSTAYPAEPQQHNTVKISVDESFSAMKRCSGGMVEWLSGEAGVTH